MIKIKRMAQRDKTLKLFTNFDGAMEYINKHIKLVNPGEECKIFTYGVYAGIYRNAQNKVCANWMNSCFQFLHQCCHNKTKVIIYVGNANGDTTTQERIVDIEDMFKPFVTCKEYKGHHKLLLLSDGWGYFGSCNFTGSSLGDLIIAGNLYEISSGIIWDKTLTSLISEVASHKI